MSDNKQKWFSLLGGNLQKDLQYIIVNFFIKDNVSFDKYFENQNANNLVKAHGSLDIFEKANSLSIDMVKMPSPTKNFKEFFCKDYYDRPIGIPDWFMLGYPDVSVWLSKDDELIDSLLTNGIEIIDSDGKPNFKFYRIAIDYYKKKYGKLESEL